MSYILLWWALPYNNSCANSYNEMRNKQGLHLKLARRWNKQVLHLMICNKIRIEFYHRYTESGGTCSHSPTFWVLENSSAHSCAALLQEQWEKKTSLDYGNFLLRSCKWNIKMAGTSDCWWLVSGLISTTTTIKWHRFTFVQIVFLYLFTFCCKC